MSALVEADLPFKLTGSLRRAWPTAAGHGFLTVMLALEATRPPQGERTFRLKLECLNERIAVADAKLVVR